MDVEEIIERANKQRTYANETFFRQHQEYISNSSWVSPLNLRWFSKDFIREFKNKFKWELNGDGVVELIIKGRDFYKEIIGNEENNG